MNSAPSLLDSIQEIFRDIDQARTLEALYENLAHYLAKIGGTRVDDVGTSAFMTIVKYSIAGHTFQIANGTGKYAAAAGSMVRDGPILEHLSNAIRQRSNHYSRDAVTFCFPHPENFAILVYVELAQEIDAGAQELLKFVNDKVVSSIRTHSLSKQTVRTGRAMVIALASLAEHKDQDTGDHIMRVAIMTDEIVQVLGELGYYPEKITPEFERHVSTASILHDVGKISIPDSILKKPGKLDMEERKIIEAHTLKGKKVLEKASRILDDYNYLLTLSCEIALYHHEHYNGQGYPARIAGQEIPLSARIVGLVDVFDALTSERSYKKAWTDQEAIAYISEQSGKQFDPLVVEAFFKVMEYRKDIVLIQWTEALSVKVPSMDSDHRVLVGLINQLASAEKIGNRRVAESVLDELLNYAIDHFDREEQFLHKSGYPLHELVKHKLQHASFNETIQDIRWQYLHGFRPRINQEVLFFLRDWLSKHILVEDMKYADTVGAQ
ncbi:MAG: bacteriohemerythrin [Gallionella sp.]|nr:bacteriohemerythrin [Gallionella sp.]